MICVLPNLDKIFDLRTRLRPTIKGNLSYCKLKVISRYKCRLYTLFRFKDSLEKKNCSGIIYHYACSNCKLTHHGKAFRIFLLRAAEHMGLSSLTGKRLQNVEQAVCNIWLSMRVNCSVNFDDLDNLAVDSNMFRLLLREISW